ncbi:NAD-dependent DNA ligase LigA [Thermoflavifilum thermophilum]|nr:NAD-dependent DNA ligase LigA [Thermoflavifilum thermophilum]
MYTPEQEKELSRLLKHLLEQKAEDTAPEQHVQQLRQALRYAEWRYYVQDDPVISDSEYDQLFHRLKQIEEKHPELVTPDSPTQRIASGLTEQFPTVVHLTPMLSLDNSYNAEDLRDWDRRVKELSGISKVDYCIEPKYDGASISLIYENDMLVRGATRGDGVRGDEITTNIKQIKAIPLAAPFSSLGIRRVEIRGEVLMHKDTFKALNQQRLAENLPPFANPRNATSGSLRMIDPREVAKRKLQAVLYQISFVEMADSQPLPQVLHYQSGVIKTLHQLGFPTPYQLIKIVHHIDEAIQYLQEFEHLRDTLPYEIDGMVIKVDDLRLQEKIGATTHHPRWAMAYKFKARQATSVLRKVEFQVGRTGTITPVAKIDPVPIGGVTISSISLFNEDVIREKDLRIGDTVLVERAGDVIPYIVKPVVEMRTGKEKPIQFPHHCPVCGDTLVKTPGEAAWRCVNINCEAQVLERIIHFVSKDAMDIKSLGEANVRRFYELGLLRSIPDIYRLDYDKIKQLEGFGEKSVHNLQQAVEASKKQPLHRLIFALGIRYVGETTARTLAQAIHYLPDLQHWSVDQLTQLPDIGPKVAGSIYDFFHNADNIRMLQELEKLGVNMHNQAQPSRPAGKLAGKTFLFTGTLPHLKRHEAEALVEQHGGKIANSVSRNLDYLVVGEEPGSKLEKARKMPSVKIIDESQFLKLIESA